MSSVNVYLLFSPALEIVELGYYTEFVLVRLAEFSNMFVFLIFLLKCLEYRKV